MTITDYIFQALTVALAIIMLSCSLCWIMLSFTYNLPRMVLTKLQKD
jgi:hypothetical protein